MRLIPQILINNKSVVKGKRFINHLYIGDPINTIRILNEKDVDEIQIINISGTKFNYIYLKEIVSNCFAPVSFGGYIREIADAEKIFKCGVEKIIINSIVYTKPLIIEKLVNLYGQQSISLSIDYKRKSDKISLFSNSGIRYERSLNINKFIEFINNFKVGEVILTNIELEGSRDGVDYHLIEKLESKTKNPLIISGGINDDKEIYKIINKYSLSGISMGANCMFRKPLNAVLIHYPTLLAEKNQK